MKRIRSTSSHEKHSLPSSSARTGSSKAMLSFAAGPGAGPVSGAIHPWVRTPVEPPPEKGAHSYNWMRRTAMDWPMSSSTLGMVRSISNERRISYALVATALTISLLLCSSVSARLRSATSFSSFAVKAASAILFRAMSVIQRLARRPIMKTTAAKAASRKPIVTGIRPPRTKKAAIPGTITGTAKPIIAGR